MKVGRGMTLRRLQRTWNRLGESDPLWAVLSDPSKKGGKWSIDEFFGSGEHEIHALIQYLNSLEANPRRGRALDFGCGVGRLTQALAGYFTEVVGVDIAPSMIALAQRYNRHEDNCRYCLNETGDLSLFGDGSFDLVLSLLTLQHIRPDYAQHYIGEFVRVLAPGGLLIFQLPSHRLPGNNLKQVIKGIAPPSLVHLYRKIKLGDLSLPRMEMHGIQQDRVVRLLQDAGAEIVDVVEDGSASVLWRGYRYCCRKRGA